MRGQPHYLTSHTCEKATATEHTMIITPTLAVGLSELVEKFGIHTDAFISHSIAFIFLMLIMVKFGIKPIKEQLDTRRARIEEGEAMRAESKKALADVQQSSELLLDDARQQAQDQLNHANVLAQAIHDNAILKASTDALVLLSNANKQAELEEKLQKIALRGEFARLLAEATSQVTGKILSEDDHRRITEEAIKQL